MIRKTGSSVNIINPFIRRFRLTQRFGSKNRNLVNENLQVEVLYNNFYRLLVSCQAISYKFLSDLKKQPSKRSGTAVPRKFVTESFHQKNRLWFSFLDDFQG